MDYGSGHRAVQLVAKQRISHGQGGRGSAELGAAVVQRPDGVSDTVLRKMATNKRDESVWVDERTRVANGEQVVVVRPDQDGFTYVQASNMG